jgi:hypothetical protein
MNTIHDEASSLLYCLQIAERQRIEQVSHLKTIYYVESLSFTIDSYLKVSWSLECSRGQEVIVPVEMHS